MSSQAVNVMKRFISSLSETGGFGNGLDIAVRKASNGRFWNYKELYNSFFNTLDSSYKKGTSLTSFLKTYCGINYDNKDTGAVTGLDAGGKTVKTPTSIVKNLVPVNKWKMPTSNKVMINGTTFIFPKLNTLSNKEKQLVKGLTSSWLKASLDLIKESYGITFNSKNNLAKSIKVTFKNVSGVNFAYINTNSYDGMLSSVELVINKNIDYANNADGTPIGNWIGDLSFDRLVCHELTHALVDANIPFYNEISPFIREGLAELVHGIDDTRKSFIFSSLSKSKLSKTKSIAKSTSKERWQIGTYGASVPFLRYLAKQSLDDKCQYLNSAKTKMGLTSSFTGTYNMSSWNKVTSVDASNNSKNITIKGTAANNTIYLGKGTDVVYGYNGNDTIYVTAGKNHKVNGGNGSDKITVSGSTATTVSANAGNDTIILSGGTQGKILGNDGNDIITVKAGANYNISGNNGNDTFTVSGGSNNIYHGNNGNDVFTIKGGNNNNYYGDIGNNKFNISKSVGNAKIYLSNVADNFNNQINFTNNRISDFTFKKDKNALILSNDSSMITIYNWNFKDKNIFAFSDRTTYSVAGLNKYINNINHSIV